MPPTHSKLTLSINDASWDDKCLATNNLAAEKWYEYGGLVVVKLTSEGNNFKHNMHLLTLFTEGFNLDDVKAKLFVYGEKIKGGGEQAKVLYYSFPHIYDIIEHFLYKHFIPSLHNVSIIDSCNLLCERVTNYTNNCCHAKGIQNCSNSYSKIFRISMVLWDM